MRLPKHKIETNKYKPTKKHKNDSFSIHFLMENKDASDSFFKTNKTRTKLK